VISYFSRLGDPALVVLSFLWIFAMVLVGETTRRLGGWPPAVTRKVIHVGVGFWALPTALWFDSPGWAIVCPAIFVILNAISYRYRLMAVIEEDGRGSPGTIYFPLIFAVLILALWPVGQRAASVAGLFALGFGDAAASMIGRRWGRHRYTLGRGVSKSWEGSLAMLAVSFPVILWATWACGLDRPPWIPSLGAALAGAAAEAPAGRGLDNLTVPVAAALTFWGLRGAGL
jgi:dolichol kinase